MGVLAQIAQDAGDGGPPDSFIALFVIAVVLAVGVGVAKRSWIRDMAQRRGLDPDDASKAAFFGGELGVAAAYLKGDEPRAAALAPSSRPAAERLAELELLRDQQLITDAEYAERRRTIIDSI